MRNSQSRIQSAYSQQTRFQPQWIAAPLNFPRCQQQPCGRCGVYHVQRCHSITRICFKCKHQGHCARMCRTKIVPVHSVKVEKKESQRKTKSKRKQQRDQERLHSIKKAVSLINGLDSSKFPLLLTRILQKIHLKDERTFSEEEESKLQGALELPAPDLELVIQTLEYFLHQAAYHTAKPGVLSQQLTQLEVDEDKVKAIVEAWSNSARDVVQKLRQRTIVPDQLDAINWRLNLQMAQSTKTKMKMPNAMFELDVKNENTEKNEKIRMEFTHDELYAFYNQLETIQKQLDGLS